MKLEFFSKTWHLAISKKKSIKVFLESNIAVLDWPGHSLDLNPIENLWGIIKCRLRKIDCTTMRKLVEAIIEVWYHDNKIADKCRILVESMPNRIHDQLKARRPHQMLIQCFRDESLIFVCWYHTLVLFLFE